MAETNTADHMDIRKDIESQAAHWSHYLRCKRMGFTACWGFCSWEPPCLADCPCTQCFLPSEGFPFARCEHPSSPDATDCAPPRQTSWCSRHRTAASSRCMAGSEHGFGGAERKNTIKTESLKILLNKKQFTNFDLNQALSKEVCSFT